MAKCIRCEKNKILKLEDLPLFPDIQSLYPYCNDCITLTEKRSYVNLVQHKIIVEINDGIKANEEKEKEKESTFISELRLLYSNS